MLPSPNAVAFSTSNTCGMREIRILLDLLLCIEGCVISGCATSSNISCISAITLDVVVNCDAWNNFVGTETSRTEKDYLGANSCSRCLQIRSDDRVWCTSSWDSGASSCLCAGSGLSNRVGLLGTTRWGFLITHDGHNMLLAYVKPCLSALMYFDWLQRAWNLLVQTGEKMRWSFHW